MRRAGAELTEEAPSGDLHRTRIRTKQLRYTLECFTDLHGRPASRLVRRTVRLQDVLGALQDAAVLGEQLREAAEREHNLPASSVFLLGQLAGVYAERIRSTRRQVPDMYRRQRVVEAPEAAHAVGARAYFPNVYTHAGVGNRSPS